MKYETIESGLEFSDGAVDRVVRAFVTLPVPLRPRHFSHDEKIRTDADQIKDKNRFADFLRKSSSGFILSGTGVTYSIRIASAKGILCDCFIDLEPEAVKTFMVHMSSARPLFGFACAPGEREYRNRITVRLHDKYTVETWVGRDMHKYMPGFYWLTLVPDTLARQHGIPLSTVEQVSIDHLALAEEQHLFQFYERPDDWSRTSRVAQLCASLPGVFDIEKVRPQALTAMSILDLNAVLKQWK